jgi:5S rRNA maturation endonuclease (ribonuclease M5)
MTRDEFLQRNTLEAVCRERGIELIGRGTQRKAKCPFHADRTPSMSVNVKTNIWNCFAGCGGGSVIDLLARLDGLSIADFMRGNSIGSDAPKPAPSSIFKSSAAPKKRAPVHPASSKQSKEIECVYSYCNVVGKEVYQVVRYKPKDFRPRHKVDGEWVYGLDGVERVLYHLPEIAQCSAVWLVEGEKDADNLCKLGIIATTNAGGANGWLDSYAVSLRNKEVIICGDNDEPGQEFVSTVFDALKRHAKSIKLIRLPSKFKDVSDYIAKFNSADDATQALRDLQDSSSPYLGGVKLPVYSMAEISKRYQKHAVSLEKNQFNLHHWLPSLKTIRGLVPGEVMLVIGDTGSGKTGVGSNIAIAALPLPTVFFELELPDTLLFERFVAARRKITCKEVEEAYAKGDYLDDETLDHEFKNLYICPESGLTVDEFERLIVESELKIGQSPKVVIADYVQLFRGHGKSRYERISDIAERIKVIAKSTQTIIVLLSQVHRPSEDAIGISLHSGKDSGSLENSAGVVLGVWRDPEDTLNIKILKNTKGMAGARVICNFDGAKMLITERSKVDDKSIPPEKPAKHKTVVSPESTPYRDD